MESIEQTFFDNEGNHLLVALCFCDDEYKRQSLQIPEEYASVDVIDIEITKLHVDKPIHFGVFFRMSSWLLQQFDEHRNAIFTFICSTDDLNTNHSKTLPQEYRWRIFDKLYQRVKANANMNVQDIIIGPKDYQSFGRAFYRDEHSPIIHIVASFLQEKQLLYN